MKDISDAAELIATAREALLNGLLPTLTKDQRYAGLMIANAMAIALREHRSGMDARREEIARLRNLLGDAAPGTVQSMTGDVESDLAPLRRALTAKIRRGEYDNGGDNSGATTALVAHLARTSAAWVAISNPKALRAEDAAT